MQAVVTARGAGTGLLERRPGSEAIERSWATTFAQAERAGERQCEPSCTAKTGTGSPLAGGLLWIGRVAAAVGLGSFERDTQGAAPLGRGSKGAAPPSPRHSRVRRDTAPKVDGDGAAGSRPT